MFAANDALGKWLVTDYSVAELMLIRSLGSIVLIAALMRSSGATLKLPPGQGWLHALRILMLAGDSFSFYFATKALPLADVMTFYMSAPLIITRRLRDCHWLTLVAWQFIGCGIVGVLASPFDWVTPTPLDFFLMAVVGLVACGCFMLVTKALSLAPASLLAPFQYTAIVWATILRWIFFGDTPTSPIIIGSLIIIASGLFVLYRERTLKVAVNERVEPIP